MSPLPTRHLTNDFSRTRTPDISDLYIASSHPSIIIPQHTRSTCFIDRTFFTLPAHLPSSSQLLYTHTHHTLERSSHLPESECKYCPRTYLTCILLYLSVQRTVQKNSTRTLSHRLNLQLALPFALTAGPRLVRPGHTDQPVHAPNLGLCFADYTRHQIVTSGYIVNQANRNARPAAPVSQIPECLSAALEERKTGPGSSRPNACFGITVLVYFPAPSARDQFSQLFKLGSSGASFQADHFGRHGVLVHPRRILQCSARISSGLLSRQKA